MARYYNPISPVSSGSSTTSYMPPNQPQAQANTPAPPSQPEQSASSQGSSNAQSTADSVDLQKYLDNALKNSSVKAEISFVRGGYSVVRLVQKESGQVLLQMPSQTVLSIISAMGGSDSSADDDMPVFPSAGAVINEIA